MRLDNQATVYNKVLLQWRLNILVALSVCMRSNFERYPTLTICCRQEILAIECHLLQNALESQRHVACIHDWEQLKPSPAASSSSPPCQSEEPSTSPDSGAVMSPIMEPLDVVSSREELATLVADKQRMEAQHKRLQRHLRETRAKMAEVQEVREHCKGWEGSEGGGYL